MESLFINVAFEPAMYFLMDTVDNCIKNRIFGFINKKNAQFSVQFVLLELKNPSVKRKSEDDQHFDGKKMRKLNASLESLLLDNDTESGSETTDHVVATKKMNLEKATAGSSGERKRVTTAQNDLPLGKKIKLEAHTLRNRKPRN